MTDTTSSRSGTLNNQPLPATDPPGGLNWDTKTLLVGTALGAAVGLATSWLMVRTSRAVRGGPPRIGTTDALKVGITTIGLMRAIAALGED